MLHPVEAPLRSVLCRAALLSVLAIAVPAVLPAHAGTDVSLTLKWSAPGDDSLAGRATAYDLRRSSTPITELNFNTATQLTGLPTPQTAGALESYTVSGLLTGVQYYFALRTRDDAGNWSKISNLVAYPLLVGVEDEGPLTISFSTPFPNPSREPVHFAYSLPRGGDVGVDVYDVSGRSVRSLIRGFRGAGHQDLVWDLRTDDGRTVAPGVYLVHAKIAGQQWNRRVVVTR